MLRDRGGRHGPDVRPVEVHIPLPAKLLEIYKGRRNNVAIQLAFAPRSSPAGGTEKDGDGLHSVAAQGRFRGPPR